MGEQPQEQRPQVFEAGETEARDRSVNQQVDQQGAEEGPESSGTLVEVPAREVVPADEGDGADEGVPTEADDRTPRYHDAGAASTSEQEAGAITATTALVGEAGDMGQAGDGGDQGDDGGGDEGDLGAGPDGGHVRVGEETSSSIRYSQEITSPEEGPEREGRSLATTHHEVIKEWAEERGATPATVEGTEHGDQLGVLRLDFSGDNENLRHVSWEEWFETFDVRRLNFIYQENRRDGRQSNFFRLESPDREDG